MRIYAVGGVIRDTLLGLPIKDRDYVVVGATPQQMIAKGFRPVGNDFPVFLHPKNHEQYALARTERKIASGYNGFSFYCAPDVRLKDDLMRRDLTINAMAQEVDAHGKLIGPIIDPYGGQLDLAGRRFRHVSGSFVEDPVRVLRIARFSARLPDFILDHETLKLMINIVKNGEIDTLVPERVWKEISRGLMEIKPSRMFEVLRICGALSRILPEIENLWKIPAVNTVSYSDRGIKTMMMLESAAVCDYSLSVRFAVLTHAIYKNKEIFNTSSYSLNKRDCNTDVLKRLCERLRIPKRCSELAYMVAQEHENMHQWCSFGANALVEFLERCDAIRKPLRFYEMIQACEICARTYFKNNNLEQYNPLLVALKTAYDVDTRKIASRFSSTPSAIKKAIHAARVEAVASATGRIP